MGISSTLYTITITNGNSDQSPPNDGFVDNLKITDYGLNLESTPADLTLELCQAKVRGNFRYRDIINQLGIVANCFVYEQPYSDWPYTTYPKTTSDATAIAEASSFSFMIIVEHGDASMVTADELNAGAYLTGTACAQRCVARALINDMFRIVDVFDPTDSTSTTTAAPPPATVDSTSVIRFGDRIMTGTATTAIPPAAGSNFEIGPYAESSDCRRGAHYSDQDDFLG